MITDAMIDREYIRSTVVKGLDMITEIQDRVIRDHLNVVSGRLSSMVSSRPFEIADYRFGVRTLTYMRFLDINYKKGYGYRKATGLALYNRAIWGVLYHETLPSLRYGLTKDIRREIADELKTKEKRYG